MAPRRKAAAAAASEVTPEVDTRGQMALPLGGHEFMLRPSWEAIERIEAKLGSIVRLSEAALAFALRVGEMATITAELMRAYGEANPKDPLHASYKGATPEKLSKMIYEAGIPRICIRLSVVLSGAVNGGYTATGEAKAGTSTSEAIPAGG